MFLPDEFINQVRDSVNIVRAISDYVSLKKRGKNYIALCPFHSEKTPSFYVSEEKQIFHCFGCSTGGDVFKFVTLIEHIHFPEAVKLIGQKFGISLPKTLASKTADSEHREKILEVLEETTKFYHRTLVADSEGKGGLAYLLDRGILETTIEMFRIGYAPNSGDRLLASLSKKGFSADVIERAGLIRRSAPNAGYSDYFRKRIIFPILDVSSRVLAFGGRSLGTAVPKYLNSPDTLVYNKGKNLFGLCVAKDSIKKTGFVVLVEGYLDFLIPYQAGIQNTVASLGTGLTEQQVKLLARYTRNVVVNYDSDAAGLSAAKRSVELFLREGFKVNVALLPDGKDPDLYVREAGIESYKQTLKSSMPYLEFLAETAFKAEKDVTSSQAKINILNSVLPYLARVPNKIERASFASRIAQRIKLEDELILSELKKAVEAQRTRIEQNPIRPNDIKPAEDKLLRTILENPRFYTEIFSKLNVGDIEGLRSEKIFKAIIDLYGQKKDIDLINLQPLLDQESIKLLIQLCFQEEPVAQDLKEVDGYINALKRSRLEAYMKQLQIKIADAERRQDDERLMRFYEEKREVTQQLYALYES